MPAYLFVTCVIHDRAAFMAGYSVKAAALTKAMGGRYVFLRPGGEWMEGGFGPGASMVVSEWPTREAAKAFWNSPEYAQIKTLREGIADAQVLLMDGEFDFSG